MRKYYRRTQNVKLRNRSCSCLITVIIAVILLSMFAWIGIKYITPSIEKRMYPIKYRSSVEKYSEINNLDKYLVYAIIKTESGFNPSATSKANARGLMQLKDETAEDAARMMKIDVNIPRDLYDPDTNIKLGCYYLNWLINRYDGEIEMAIIAYNGGIGNVQNWLHSDTITSGENGIEGIPFSETQNYVKTVMSSYNAYLDIYE